MIPLRFYEGMIGKVIMIGSTNDHLDGCMGILNRVDGDVLVVKGPASAEAYVHTGTIIRVSVGGELDEIYAAQVVAAKGRTAQVVAQLREQSPSPRVRSITDEEIEALGSKRLDQ